MDDTQADVEGLVARLRESARAHSEASRMMAEAKSLRQGDGTRNDLYMWTKPEDTPEWQAADTIERLTTLQTGREQALENSATVNQWVAEAFGATDNEFRRVSRCNEEMSELITAIASDLASDKIAEEAADVAILLHLICARRGRDLGKEVDRKMAINRKREWAVDETGCGYHVKPPALKKDQTS